MRFSDDVCLPQNILYNNENSFFLLMFVVLIFHGLFDLEKGKQRLDKRGIMNQRL